MNETKLMYDDAHTHGCAVSKDEGVKFGFERGGGRKQGVEAPDFFYQWVTNSQLKHLNGRSLLFF
jgi:hypothetical protein